MFFFIKILDIKWFNLLLTRNEGLACVIPKCVVCHSKMCGNEQLMGSLEVMRKHGQASNSSSISSSFCREPSSAMPVSCCLARRGLRAACLLYDSERFQGRRCAFSCRKSEDTKGRCFCYFSCRKKLCFVLFGHCLWPSKKCPEEKGWCRLWGGSMLRFP